MIRRWWFSLFLAAVYLGIFRFWADCGRRATLISGLGAVALTSAVFARAARRNYFWNRWDGWIHVAVIVDLGLEAVLVPSHEPGGVYLCALGFAAVVVAYRAWLKHLTPPAPATEAGEPRTALADRTGPARENRV